MILSPLALTPHLQVTYAIISYPIKLLVSESQVLCSWQPLLIVVSSNVYLLLTIESLAVTKEVKSFDSDTTPLFLKWLQVFKQLAC